MAEKLFIYGTLAPGRPNEHIMDPIDGTWEPATVKGHLCEGGWGSALGYPGINLDEAGDVVKGFLFSSDKLPEFWSYLDDFEGEGYDRVFTKATRSDGSTVEAYIYALAKPPEEK